MQGKRINGLSRGLDLNRFLSDGELEMGAGGFSGRT